MPARNVLLHGVRAMTPRAAQTDQGSGPGPNGSRANGPPAIALSSMRATIAAMSTPTRPPSPDTIFVSVASYCDPLLEFTLQGALERAARPDRLVLAVVEQQWPDDRLRPDPALAARLRHLPLHPLQARGPCWARALAMSLYQGERWFLQIDSHTHFEPGWDERLVDWAKACQRMNPRCLLTAYPNPFRLVDGVPQVEQVGRQVLAHVVKTACRFAPEHPVLMFESVPVDCDQPVLGLHVAAGCLFAPGEIVDALPYDPFLYFHGEEQSMALRAWTRGWDIFHIPELPLYHHYVDPLAPPQRAMHWSPELDEQRPQRAAALEAAANLRLRALLWEGAALGAYGLGGTRSLADYAQFSGIDYAARRIHPGAYKARFGY